MALASSDSLTMADRVRVAFVSFSIRVPRSITRSLSKSSFSAQSSRTPSNHCLVNGAAQAFFSRWVSYTPRASYRAENPTNPKIRQKYKPDIQIPPMAGDRKNTPKRPEKYPEDTNFVFFEYSRGYLKGYLKGYFGESHVLYVGGYFCTSLAFLFCSWSRGCQPWVSYTLQNLPESGVTLPLLRGSGTSRFFDPGTLFFPILWILTPVPKGPRRTKKTPP